MSFSHLHPPFFFLLADGLNQRSFILQQLGRPEICSAPAAFRHLLTEGLALDIPTHYNKSSNSCATTSALS